MNKDSYIFGVPMTEAGRILGAVKSERERMALEIIDRLLSTPGTMPDCLRVVLDVALQKDCEPR